jgi:hypothetical protein
MFAGVPLLLAKSQNLGKRRFKVLTYRYDFPGQRLPTVNLERLSFRQIGHDFARYFKPHKW